MKTWYGENCKECKGLNEPYVVKDTIWKKAGLTPRGFVCISCLESKLKRKLKLSDFIDAPINKGIFGFEAEAYIKYGKNYLTYCHKFVKNRRNNVSAK